MEDLIKREDAIKAVLGLTMYKGCIPVDSVIFNIKNIPSAEKQGEWIPCTKSGLPLTEMMRREGQKWYGYKCSKCNFVYKGNALTESPFCQNCRARMFPTQMSER